MKRRFTELTAKEMRAAIHGNILIYRAFCNLACEYVISGYHSPFYKIYFKGNPNEKRYQFLVKEFHEKKDDETGMRLIRFHDSIRDGMMHAIHQNVDSFITLYRSRLRGTTPARTPAVEEKRYAQELATMYVDDSLKLMDVRYSPNGDIKDETYIIGLKKILFSYTGNHKKTVYKGHSKITTIPYDYNIRNYIDQNREYFEKLQ